MSKIYLQHEIQAYQGCSQCKQKTYLYYFGSDKKFYCEDCSRLLVNKGDGIFGRWQNNPKLKKALIDENATIRELRNELERERVRVATWINRCEELEVVAAALYLGHDDAKEQFHTYKEVYLIRSVEINKQMNNRDLLSGMAMEEAGKWC